MANIQKYTVKNIATATTDYIKAVDAFDEKLKARVSKDTERYIEALNLLDTSEDMVEWRKAYIVAKVWEGFRTLDGKKKKDNALLPFWNGSMPNYYNYLRCGRKVKQDENGTLITPKDANGASFQLSNYALIVTRKTLDEEIKNGVFLATMTQKAVKETIKTLKGVVNEGEAVEEETSEAEASEGEATADNITTKAKAEIYLEINGEEIELTEEQKIKILEIIAG